MLVENILSQRPSPQRNPFRKISIGFPNFTYGSSQFPAQGYLAKKKCGFSLSDMAMTSKLDP
jgi:hypothetical protein